MDEDLKMIRIYEKEFSDTYKLAVLEENEALADMYAEKLKLLAQMINRQRKHFKLLLQREALLAAEKAQA